MVTYGKFALRRNVGTLRYYCRCILENYSHPLQYNKQYHRKDMAVINTLHLTGHTNSLLYRLEPLGTCTYITVRAGEEISVPHLKILSITELIIF